MHYAAAVLTAFLLAWWQLGLTPSNLWLPLTLDGDAAYYYSKAKELLEFGSTWQNDRLGAPFGSVSYQLPYHPACQYLALRALCVLAGDAALGMNLYYLLGFPLAAVCSLWALRRLGIDRGPAFVASILFSLQYYHFWRGVTHPMLSAYFLVPPAMLWAVRVGELRPRSLLLALAFCAVLGGTYVYYSFFTAVCIVVLALWRAPTGWRPARQALLMLTFITAGGAASVWPALQHRLEHGRNTAACQRSFAQAEHYGLRLSHLLMPHEEHRVPALARVAASHNAALRGTTRDEQPEWQASSIGVVAGLGVIGLLGLLLMGAAWTVPRWLTAFAVLEVALLLLCMRGGLATIVAFVLPEIRGYNRVSILIAWFGLAAVAYGLQRWRSIRGYRVLLALVLGVGLLDQMPARYRGADNEVALRDLQSFVAAIEARLPPAAMVFQLPLHSFPEAGPCAAMPDYAHLAGYFYSKALRFNYGAMRAEPPDTWQRGLLHTADSTSSLVHALRASGFAAIWLDRRGYADATGAALESQLESELGKPLRSGTLACFWL